jgi:murein DD-endopeptidase MepM/ murein hydrolase activator NlpD
MIPSPFTIILGCMALFLALPTSAQQAHLPDPVTGLSWMSGSAIEGGLMVARVAPGVSLALDGELLPLTDDRHAMIGFHRDSDAPARLVVTEQDGTRHVIILEATQRDYAVQRIDGLKRDHVTPPPRVLERIGADSAAVRAARARHDAGRLAGDFLNGLDMPVEGRITGVYGSQRILNGEPRQPHYGIDIAAPRGTPVIAPAGGRVTLVRDLYFSGWTVLMTHGLGLNSAFLHLDSVAVATGDEVERGGVIGTVGSTGRSTGPHLDWRLDWQGRRLDAALVRQQLAGLRDE